MIRKLRRGVTAVCALLLALSMLAVFSAPVGATTCPCTIWPSTAVPGHISTDGTANELGVKFKSDVAGTVTGIRFYKGTGNTGTHTGHLWSLSGTLLASVTFTGESSTGWQQANFGTGVAITAGTTYVASYFAPKGHYGQDVSGLTNAVNNAPLHTIANSVSVNGVYHFGSSAFPTNTYSASNYWVDLVLTTVNPPPQVTGLTATAVSSSEIDLAWNAAAGATSYIVNRSPDGSTWTQVGTPSLTTFANTGLASNTLYYYQVVATNAGGNAPPSASASATTFVAVPPQVTGLTATVISQTEIDLSWTASAGATSYIVNRSPDGSTWTQIGTPTGTTFPDTGLTANTLYEYQVIATNSGGNAPPSSTVSATTLPNPPPQVTGLTATVISQTEIDLAWSSSAGATNYLINRSPDGATWTQVGSTTATTFASTGLSASTLYYYQVVATNAGGNAPASASVSATTLPNAPAQVTGLAATVVGQTEIDLTWNASAGATNYLVNRSPDGSTWTQVGSTSATTFANTGLAPATLYYYQVVATNTGGNAPASASASATTLPNPPPQVTGLTATAVSSTEIDLAWSSATGATNYLVNRSPDGTTNWTQVGTTSATTFANTGLTASTTYFYQVVATNTGGSAPPSATASATTPAAPPSCTGVTVNPGPTTIQNAVAANGNSTTFCLQPGVYRIGTTIAPKTGDTFVGQAGVDLTGANTITVWTPSGSQWTASGALPAAYTDSGYSPCQGGGTLCTLDESVFRDNVELTRVATAGAVVPGTVNMNYTSNVITIADDPIGHTMEVSRTRRAFESTNANVTIDGLLVEKFAVENQKGAVLANANGWTIRNCEVRFNHSAGLYDYGSTYTVFNDHIHHNGVLGIGVHAATGVSVTYNELDHNNTDGGLINDGENGGYKSTRTSDVVSNNNVHDNLGMGLWFDIDDNGNTIQNNTLTNNAASGIRYEISYNGTISGNTFSGNGLNRQQGDGSLTYGASVDVDTSATVAVYGNTISGGDNGIGLSEANRGSGIYGVHDLTNVTVHDNTVTMTQGVTGLVQSVGNNAYFTSKGNTFNTDTYHLDSLSSLRFAWNNTFLTGAQWQTAGQEAAGTFVSP